MKIKYYLLLPLLTFFFFACNSKKEKKNQKSEKTVVVEKISRADIDSIRFEKALKKALKFVRENYKKEKFQHAFFLESDSSTFDINTEILTGDLFDDQNDYVLIKRKFIIDRAYLNLYKKHNKELIELMIYRDDHLMYINDTIFDVNGDGRKDFVLHQYPSSGCCLANVYRVFLNGKNGFDREYEFLNPTFASKEKQIRGFGYGHPGMVNLYKYAWNGFEIDTLESISSLLNPINGEKESDTIYRFIKKGEIVEKLLELPKEYQNINGIEWYLGDL